ncbi:DUF1016 family protein [Candidatus Saccharibacteria bacterium]|nr:DUF1016 family protein [Candidatus Saccharibacteria bacterium]
MNYYEEIKKELLDNEVNKTVKDCSKNEYEIKKYCAVGKLLLDAGSQYGERIIKEYSERLKREIGRKYSVRYLFDIRRLYLFSKVHPVGAQLTISHYRLLFPLDDREIDYYMQQVIERNLSKRDLEAIIKSREYSRIPAETKCKLADKKRLRVEDFVKNPINIRDDSSYEAFSEKILQKLILEDIESFMKELGNSFCFIGSEYKIKIGGTYNYIDLLLFNYEYDCFVVIELKVSELKKEHIGQLQIYMNYIDRNLKKPSHDKTIGIIICRQQNKYVIKYCSDNRIIAREYNLV